MIEETVQVRSFGWVAGTVEVISKSLSEQLVVAGLEGEHLLNCYFLVLTNGDLYNIL